MRKLTAHSACDASTSGRPRPHVAELLCAAVCSPTQLSRDSTNGLQVLAIMPPAGTLIGNVHREGKRRLHARHATVETGCRRAQPLPPIMHGVVMRNAPAAGAVKFQRRNLAQFTANTAQTGASSKEGIVLRHVVIAFPPGRRQAEAKSLVFAAGLRDELSVARGSVITPHWYCALVTLQHSSCRAASIWVAGGTVGRPVRPPPTGASQLCRVRRSVVTLVPSCTADALCAGHQPARTASPASHVFSRVTPVQPLADRRCRLDPLMIRRRCRSPS